MTTTYTDAQFSELIDEMLSYARMVGYAKSAGERENHRRSCDTTKDIVMSAYTDALAERKAAIQPQVGEVGYEMVDIFQAAADDYHRRNGGDVDRMHHWRMQVLYGIRAVIKALPPQPVNWDGGDVRGDDDNLPGMWSHSDFTGGDPDERGYSERAEKLDTQPHQHVRGDGGDVRGDLLQSLAAAMYQAAGAYDMPVRFLDILSAVGNGEQITQDQIDALLPCETPEYLRPVRNVSEEDVRQCLSVWRKSPIHMDAEQTMRAVLDAFLKGGEDHELSEEGDTP